MRSININVPESLAEFAEEQAIAEGHPCISDYVAGLLKRAQRFKAEKELESLVTPALESLERGEGKEMTSEDWEQLRNQLRERHGAIATP